MLTGMGHDGSGICNASSNKSLNHRRGHSAKMGRLQRLLSNCCPAEGPALAECPQLPSARRRPGPGVPAARVPSSGGWDGTGDRRITPAPSQARASGAENSSKAGRSPAICWLQPQAHRVQATDREATRALCRLAQQPPHSGAAEAQRCCSWRLPQAARPAPSRARPSGQTKGRRAFGGQQDL